MVSSDGEPHKVLTVVAVGSGLLCAIIVLLVLVALIDYRRQQRTDRRLLLAKQQRSKSMFSLFAKRASLDITIVDERFLERCGATEQTRAADLQETRQPVPAPSWRQTTHARMDETIFDASGKLHGISTVSC